MFGKFFASAFTGSMMAAGPEVFAVWAYVIANTVDSSVELNPRLLAAVIGSDEAKMRCAIEQLCSPDPHSRSKNDDGCRLIREGEYQYRVPNHEKYRSIRDEEGRREYNRIKQQEHRAKKAMSSDESMTVNDSQACQPIQKQKQKQKQENIAPSVLVDSASQRPRIPKCPTEKILESFHEHLPMLPQVVVLNPSRKAHLSSRWREVVTTDKMDEDAGVEWFSWYWQHVSKSKFLTGRTNGHGGRVWKADFDWLLKPANFAKTVEGNYHKEAA